VRALLIVNPHATSTTPLRRDVIASALSSAVELDVVQTRYRGHATGLAAQARNDGFGLVLTLGGDGTVNEAVNGILGDAAASAALGGTADAEVVRAVDGHRARGRAATTVLYLRMILRQFYRVTDRRHPALTLERDGHPPAGPLFLGIVSNTAPWTYLGRRPVYTSREAAFERGLDLFALRSLGTVNTLRTASQLLSDARGPHGRSVLILHDQAEMTLSAARPVAFQLDGEYVGERESVRFLSVPDALRIVV